MKTKQAPGNEKRQAPISSEKRRAEKNLKERDARYRLFFEHDLTGDFIAVPQGRIIACNRAFLKMMGLEGTDVGDLPGCFEFFADPAFWNQLVDRVRSERTLESQEFEMVAGDCTRRRILVRANAVGLFGDNGELLEIRCSVFDITQRKEAEEQLRRSSERLRALSAHLQSVRESERTAVARELHDELGQVLTGLKMDIAWLDNKLRDLNAPGLRDKSRDMLKLVDSTIQLVRRLTADLRPGILDDLGLVAALEWQAQDFQTRTGTECTFSSDVDYLELSREFSTAVFRIFQESLTNVARHSGASSVAAKLRISDSDVVLEVIDNGKGITPSEASGSSSFGLVGMQERAFLFGGTVSALGRPGGGTTVTARFPLKSAM